MTPRPQPHAVRKRSQKIGRMKMGQMKMGRMLSLVEREEGERVEGERVERASEENGGDKGERRCTGRERQRATEDRSIVIFLFYKSNRPALRGFKARRLDLCVCVCVCEGDEKVCACEGVCIGSERAYVML